MKAKDGLLVLLAICLVKKQSETCKKEKELACCKEKLRKTHCVYTRYFRCK